MVRVVLVVLASVPRAELSDALRCLVEQLDRRADDKAHEVGALEYGTGEQKDRLLVRGVRYYTVAW